MFEHRRFFVGVPNTDAGIAGLAEFGIRAWDLVGQPRGAKLQLLPLREVQDRIGATSAQEMASAVLSWGAGGGGNVCQEEAAEGAAANNNQPRYQNNPPAPAACRGASRGVLHLLSLIHI